MKKLLMSLTLAVLTTGAFAATGNDLIVKTVELRSNKQIMPLPKDQIVPKGGEIGGITGGITGGTTTSGANGGIVGGGPVPPIGPIIGSSGGFGTSGSPFDRIGMVLSTAANVVALGESVYTLVQKGKPSNSTEYAPISIVPKDPLTKEVVNPFDLEDCSMPVSRKFRTTMTTAGMEVVSFEYMVVYSYGCSYNGAGKYIQTLNVIPVRVKTSYGWDFNATMKLAGIMNHGKKADPIVGALLTIKYSMNSWRTALERNDTVHVTGLGALKTYSN